MTKTRFADLIIDRPSEVGCYGFAFRLGRLTLSLTWRTERDQ